MVRTVVVGAIAHLDWQAVGMVVGPHEVIRRRFRSGVGAAWVVGCAFFEQTGVAKAAVYFVGRDMMKHVVGLVAPGCARGL